MVLEFGLESGEFGFEDDLTRFGFFCLSFSEFVLLSEVGPGFLGEEDSVLFSGGLASEGKKTRICSLASARSRDKKRRHWVENENETRTRPRAEEKEKERLETHQQIRLQPLNLHHVLLDQGSFGHPLVDLGLVLDPRRSRRVVDGREGLLQVGPRGRDGGDQTGLGLSSERVLEESGEFGFSACEERSERGKKQVMSQGLERRERERERKTRRQRERKG